MTFDLHTPSPDEGHDGIRLAVLDLLQQLDAHRIRIDAVNINADTALAGIDALQEQLAELTARVAALEVGTIFPGPDAAG